MPNKARKAKFKLFLGTIINAVKPRRIKIEFSIKVMLYTFHVFDKKVD